MSSRCSMWDTVSRKWGVSAAQTGVRVPRALPRCRLHARYGGLPRARSGTAWRTVLWVVSHVSSRPWVVSGGGKRVERVD